MPRSLEVTPVIVRLWLSSIPPWKKGFVCKLVVVLLPLTFHRSHGLNEIDLARFGSQRSRPVLDHPPVENPLDRRRWVSQDPALQRGVGALDGLHHGGDDVDKMLSKKFKPPAPPPRVSTCPGKPPTTRSLAAPT